uniref:Uncharacterized protein n=1 Tax=Arundo donax TaxID=35708 RepID=A0A0A9GCQ7_ARUDO
MLVDATYYIRCSLETTPYFHEILQTGSLPTVNSFVFKTYRCSLVPPP